MDARLFTFSGGETGPWRVVRIESVVGESLLDVPRLDVVSGSIPKILEGAKWMLQGIRSNERYVTREEKEQLVTKQAGLGRPEATCAALIPIRKKVAWWNLAQDERRTIFENHSSHVQTGLKYLPAIARRLYHCRDLGDNESFDFLTWFEFAPSDSQAFDKLVAELRASEEWTYVDREVDIRLVRE